jgi:hypothetical protein
MEKKYSIEGNDIVINHKLCSEKELNQTIELASSLGFYTRLEAPASDATGFLIEVTSWKLPNLAQNKDILNKLDEIFGDVNKEQEKNMRIIKATMDNGAHLTYAVKDEDRKQLGKLFVPLKHFCAAGGITFEFIPMFNLCVFSPYGEITKEQEAKLDSIFGYSPEAVPASSEGKWDKFRKYWEGLGKPELEYRDKPSLEWRHEVIPCWFATFDYRLKDDPNWEARLAWVDSGKTLEVEWLNPINNVWLPLPGTTSSWSGCYQYRVKPTKVVDKDHIRQEGTSEVNISIKHSFEASPEQVEKRATTDSTFIDDVNRIFRANRYNKGKPQLSYLLDTPLANNELAKVFEEGAKKYERDNWKLGLENDKLMDSALRHLQAYAGGEEIDAEIGCHHLAHVAWNVKVLLEQVLKEKGQPQRRKLCSDMDTSAIEKYVMKRTPNMEFVVASVEEGSPEHLEFQRLFADMQKSLPKWGKMTLAGKETLNLKSDVLGDSVILNHVTTPRPIDMQFPQGYGGRFFTTRERLAKRLNKDLAYTEKMADGQEVLFNDAIYVVKGD